MILSRCCKIISNFEKKAELFNSHFASQYSSQCTPIISNLNVLQLYPISMYSSYIQSQCTPIISNLNVLQLHPISIYSNYIQSQCTPNNNSTVFPPLEYKANGLLTSVNIKKDDIYLILKNLNPGKAHGWDIIISIRKIGKCLNFAEKLLRNLYEFHFCLF